MVGHITIVTDKNNWINSYIPQWIESLKPRKNQVTWVHDAKDIQPGFLAFFLGCEQIVGRSLLDLNQHNLVVHASDLPQGKGWSPLTWKILNGENQIPVVLFEAAELVDSGRIYLKHTMQFTGLELIGELREELAQTTLNLCNQFIEQYPRIVEEALEQQGESSYYPRRTPQDSRIRPELSIQEQFQMLRVADNEKYPCYFELGGETYILKIEKRG
ncbi:methionyl-tRNA formyltransferase [Paenibacillus psychroresistens]|uniref:Methionyl-tRNA formyltransferase n=1 Tax=Paenibacillus psychroresistens TaxID=1778678 RepID=A0A6B8RFT4_9BACL|nr:methionyl-tRNA formyltransferase [Paenibacillus psychroresistens]QGQ94362.1 methionyl-tRNA formyltransferase [Paenibacillus psychroresistens]